MRPSRLAHLARALLAAAALLVVAPPVAAADKGEFRPAPETYICPNVPALGIDCFLDAVAHLYTMCRHVKSIEIIEFGYAKAEEGVNGAKSEYCIDKHKASIARPLQAALREARRSPTAMEALKALHALWLGALLDLRWKPPETDEEYKARVNQPYQLFQDRASVVRTALTEQQPAPTPARTATRRTGAAGGKPAR
jgi:hypothetical protein